MMKKILLYLFAVIVFAGCADSEFDPNHQATRWLEFAYITPLEYEFDSKGGAKIYSISGDNVHLAFDVPVDWVHMDRYLELTVDENPLANPRSCIVKVKQEFNGKYYTSELKVNQAGAEPSFYIGSGTTYISSIGSDIVLTAGTNCDFDLECPTWIHLVKKTMNLDYHEYYYGRTTYGSVTLHVDENDANEVRSGYVVFKFNGNELGRCLVEQVAKEKPICPDSHHPHAIDLGLPSGTKWCCTNVGASTPEGYGGYYAWGEVNEKSEYSWDTYAYGSSDDNCQNIGSDIAGTQYDVAHVRMGGSWRMPSQSQLDELIENCTQTWTLQNGVNGILVKGKNGGSIFLPAAGYRGLSVLVDTGSYGNYCLSSLNEYKSYSAFLLYFHSDYWGWLTLRRFYGQSVRAVCP